MSETKPRVFGISIDIREFDLDTEEWVGDVIDCHESCLLGSEEDVQGQVSCLLACDAVVKNMSYDLTTRLLSHAARTLHPMTCAKCGLATQRLYLDPIDIRAPQVCAECAIANGTHTLQEVELPTWTVLMMHPNHEDYPDFATAIISVVVTAETIPHAYCRAMEKQAIALGKTVLEIVDEWEVLRIVDSAGYDHGPDSWADADLDIEEGDTNG